MQKKDYELIAGVLKQAKKATTLSPIENWKFICNLFVERLYEDDKNFDASLFYAKSGYYE